MVLHLQLDVTMGNGSCARVQADAHDPVILSQTMLRHIRQCWACIKQGEPGHRFRDSYDQHRRGGRELWAVRLLVLSASLAIIAGGLVLVPAPGPGWAIVILGLALMATVWRPAARLLDWAEPKLVSVLNSVKAWWTRRARQAGRQ